MFLEVIYFISSITNLRNLKREMESGKREVKNKKRKMGRNEKWKILNLNYKTGNWKD